jgi:hypothetical protein
MSIPVARVLANVWDKALQLAATFLPGLGGLGGMGLQLHQMQGQIIHQPEPSPADSTSQCKRSYLNSTKESTMVSAALLRL